MNLLGFFGRAPLGAAGPRAAADPPGARAGAAAAAADLVAILQQEILAVIARRLPIDRDKVVVRFDPGDQVSTLAIDIEVPQGALTAR